MSEWTAQCAEALSADGLLARQLQGFAFRESQQALSEEIARAIEDRAVLIAEAGTGTGKTYAYLVPALLSGKRVIISTGTKNLQDQLFDRDLPAVRKAIAAKKHIYCEKPTATTAAEALALAKEVSAAGLKNGVVQDKLWLPGLVKLKYLIDTGFFGRILSVRGEFGYWVFTGEYEKLQRPSWNYRKEDDGGIIVDMLCHWQYVIQNLFGEIKSLTCLGATHIPRRWDESGKPYTCTADDSAYATFELVNGVICQFNSSWDVRVRRDDLLTLQVDGTHGSAVAGLRDCTAQALAATPRCVWNPDIDSPIKYLDGWTRVPDQGVCDNAFKVEWELFLKHVVTGSPFPWTLFEGAKGVQLAELGLKSWAERRWLDVPPLK